MMMPPFSELDAGSKSRDTTAAPSSASGEQRNIYCARKPGWPGFGAVMVNRIGSKADRKRVEDGMRDWIKAGYEVAGLFTRAESVAGLEEFTAERKRRQALSPAPAPVEALPLFEDIAS